MCSELNEQEWNSWNDNEIKLTGESYKKRASGELPEKESSKSYVNLIKKKNLYCNGDSLLDIGGACGHFFRSFYERLDKNIDYTVCDIIFDYLKTGKFIFEQIENIDFVQCDALYLPFLDRSFDTVIVNLFHFFPQLDKPLLEALRVSKQRILWRTPISEQNYVIKLINENEYKNTGVITPQGNYKYTLMMMYTKKYLYDIVNLLGYEVEFILRDDDYDDFDNNQFDEFKFPASKSTGRVQVHGNLILDWHYVSIVPKNTN